MFNWLNANTLQGVLRTILAVAGGILISKGRISQDQLNTLSAQLTDPQFLGTLIAVITGVWSVMHKQATAAATPVAPVVAPTTAPVAK